MALNTFRCNRLTPLHIKGLTLSHFGDKSFMDLAILALFKPRKNCDNDGDYNESIALVLTTKQ